MQRAKRFANSRRWAAGRTWEQISFKDKKLFTWSRRTIAKMVGCGLQRLQAPLLLCKTHSLSWLGAESAPAARPLVFVYKGGKIDEDVYQLDILESAVLPWAHQHFGDAHWTFQQDSAPARRAKSAQAWCKANFPDFITHSEWPPYSPDLNPMDYSVWGVSEDRVGVKRHSSLESLMESLRQQWERLSPDDLRPIAEKFAKGLCHTIAHPERRLMICSHIDRAA
ncbi:unnamed protein product [Heligmosomoides polygyrus]|uniref:DDE_3 domain-containing protein n=1 Tax=Heligmosomoides polygyrus TaxID=6339 RepID=A0A183GMJ5_HELPZ|nr:unnamed protein product [Heligmosomoides polygyrus]